MAARESISGIQKNMLYYCGPWSKHHIHDTNKWFHLNPLIHSAVYLVLKMNLTGIQKAKTIRKVNF